MQRKSILTSIITDVVQINWDKPIYKQKAIDICTAMFNQYIIDNDNFNSFKGFSQNYFTEITRSKCYGSIKDVLIAKGVLECDNDFKFYKGGRSGVPKGYKFNPKFFVQSTLTSTMQTFTFSNSTISSEILTISYYCPNSQEGNKMNSSPSCSIEDYIRSNLDKLQFEQDIDEHIDGISIVNIEELAIDHGITDEFVQLTHKKKNYRYTREKAIEFAWSTNNSLVKFKDKFYIDAPANFIKQRTFQRKISYLHSIFNLKNRLCYCNRNTTNNRLDYNLTGLKKELFEKLLFEDEKLVELDIANAQFAIAAYLNVSIDDNFIQNAEAGSLYNYLESELNLSKGAGKALMFKVAFDKVKSDYEFGQVRALFPKYMQWVDSYKKEHGYKSFSNLLQRKEAEIMIDGLLIHLRENGYNVFPIHDALRVKESQAKVIMSLVDEYFGCIGFKCLVRLK